MGLKDELREIAFDSYADYFGIGSVDRWANAPIGHRPNDLLPSAKSVLVLGMRIPEGAIEANNRAFEGQRHGIFSYMLFGYYRLNEMLDKATMKLMRHLEIRHRIATFPNPASVPRDDYMMMGVMSNRHAAVCAGLADFGWSGLALTPDAGPRVRWITLVIDREIEPDPLYDGPKLCKGCKDCVSLCPVGALSREYSVEVKIGERVFSYGVLSKIRCRYAVYGLASGSAGRLQAEIHDNVYTHGDWLTMLRHDIVWNKTERFAAMCGRCLVNCPVGRDPAYHKTKKSSVQVLGNCNKDI